MFYPWLRERHVWRGVASTAWPHQPDHTAGGWLWRRTLGRLSRLRRHERVTSGGLFGGKFVTVCGGRAAEKTEPDDRVMWQVGLRQKRVQGYRHDRGELGTFKKQNPLYPLVISLHFGLVRPLLLKKEDILNTSIILNHVKFCKRWMFVVFTVLLRWLRRR